MLPGKKNRGGRGRGRRRGEAVFGAGGAGVEGGPGGAGVWDAGGGVGGGFAGASGAGGESGFWPAGRENSVRLRGADGEPGAGAEGDSHNFGRDRV